MADSERPEPLTPRGGSAVPPYPPAAVSPETALGLALAIHLGLLRSAACRGPLPCALLPRAAHPRVIDDVALAVDVEAGALAHPAVVAAGPRRVEEDGDTAYVEAHACVTQAVFRDSHGAAARAIVEHPRAFELGLVVLLGLEIRAHGAAAWYLVVLSHGRLNTFSHRRIARPPFMATQRRRHLGIALLMH